MEKKNKDNDDSNEANEDNHLNEGAIHNGNTEDSWDRTIEEENERKRI